MTRDGFAILAMGFTGAEAMKWKEAFLDAFNKMEAALIERYERALAEQWKKKPQLPRGPAPGMIAVPIETETLFGKSQEWALVHRDSATQWQRDRAEWQKNRRIMRGLQRKIEKLERRMEEPEKDRKPSRKRNVHYLPMNDAK